MPLTHLAYFHGFRSSPQSYKAQLMEQAVRRLAPQVHWWCPQLPPSPAQAMALIQETLATWPASGVAVLGSSLGGFYAHSVALRRHCPSVLLNPAIDPARDLSRYIGEHSAWHDPSQRFYFSVEFIEQLQQLQIENQALRTAADGDHSVPRALAVLTRGDEVLDWREMMEYHHDAEVILLPAGDHAISDFADHLPKVWAYLQPVKT